MIALVRESSARWRRMSTPRDSRVNQATCFPVSTAAWPRASQECLAGAGGAADDQGFSWRPIHSRVRGASWAGGGIGHNQRG